MRLQTILLTVLLLVSAVAQAQVPERRTYSPYEVRDVVEIPDEIKMVRGDKLRAYRITPSVARAVRVQMPDTLTHYTFEYISPEFRSLGTAYQGNMNHVWQAKLFFDRPRRVGDFFYTDGYYRMLYTPEEVRFYDTKTPFTFVRYQRNFKTNESEDVVAGDFGVNMGREINFGANFDYRNAQGFYTNSRSKDARYRLFASYRADRYELYAYVANDYYKQQENGGITNSDYILNPDRYNTNGRTKVSAKDIPVLITEPLTNRIRAGHAYLAQTYRLGSYRTIRRTPTDRELEMASRSGDSLRLDSTYFVPVGGVSLTTYYNKQSRRLQAQGENKLWKTVFGEPVTTQTRPPSGGGAAVAYAYPNDTAQLTTLHNTLALSLMEGFRPWVKFGLSAYVRQEQYWAKNPDATTHLYGVTDRFSSTFVGGLMERREGTGLNFSARGELGVLGSDLGAFRLEGDIRTAFRLFRREFALEADTYIDNARPSYFAAHHHGTYGWWDKDLKFTRRLELGGKVHLSSWGTQLEARTASLQNYIYYGAKGEPSQYSDIIQVLSLRARQTGSAGLLNWDVEAAYQTSSQPSVLPLPQLTAAADVYLRFLVAQVMRIDLGLKAYWHSAYYAPYYLPTTQQFILQTEGKIGGEAPLINAYANFRLKRARFFLQMYNVTEAFATSSRLAMYKYPYNPMYLAGGVIVDLNN